VHALEIFFFLLVVSPPEVDSSGETGRFFGGTELPWSTMGECEMRMFQGIGDVGA